MDHWYRITDHAPPPAPTSVSASCVVSVSFSSELKTTIDALTDSGSTVSVISDQMYTYLAYHLGITLDTSDQTSIRSATGHRAQSMGVTTIPLIFTFDQPQTESLVFHVPVLVVHNFPYPVLLGTDFLLQADCGLFAGRKQLLFASHGVSARMRIKTSRLRQSSKQAIANIYATEKVVIPPRTDMAFDVTLAGSRHAFRQGQHCDPALLQDKDIICAPSRAHKIALNLACCVLRPSLQFDAQQVFQLRIRNISASPMVIDRGTHLGQAFTCEAQTATIHFDLPSKDDFFTEAEIDAIKKLIRWDEMDINDAQRDHFMRLLYEYRDVFPLDPNHLGTIKGFMFDISLHDKTPFRARVTKLSMSEKEVVRQEIEKLLSQGIIRPSMSPWAAQLLLIPKPDGTLRPCVDFRGLNKQTIKMAYPVPDIDAYLHALRGHKYFCILDMNAGYWQVPVEEKSRKYTAFVCYKGQFEWNRLPMGVTNAVSYFQRMNELILSGLLWDQCLVYLDDIIVMGHILTPSWLTSVWSWIVFVL